MPLHWPRRHRASAQCLRGVYRLKARCVSITGMAEGEVANSKQAEQPGRLSVVATTTDGIHLLTLAGEIDTTPAISSGRP